MRQIASDQGLLSRIENPTQVLLAPGDRAEFEVAVGAEPIPITSTPYTLFGPVAHAENEILVTLSPQAPGLPPAFHEWPLVAKDASPLPPQPDVVYVLQGDSRTETWKINGESFPDVTIERFQAGQPVTIEVRNLSSTEHPFHTHGHAFEVLAENGIPATTYRLEDTINVSIRGTAMLRMLPTELGTWMTHCHILSHSHHMATLYEVYGGQP
jgi:FtsP/CotA-like multicopper oxidase with cupredoxin domain